MKRILLLLIATSSFIYTTAQNIGIGITNPIRARLEINGGVGRTVGVFGGEGPGISIQKEFPAIGFNQYFDINTSRYIGNGFAAVNWFNPGTGSLNFDMLPLGTANGTNPSSRVLTITNGGNVGVGNAATNGQLQLNNELRNRKFVLYESANNDFQYYGFGIENGGLRYNIDAVGAAHRFYAGTGAGSSNLLMSIGGNQVFQLGSGAAKVGINTLPFAPQTAMEINGAIALRTALVTVSNSSPLVTVGDRSYIYITSGQINTVVVMSLTDGVAAGQLLILESDRANGGAGVDIGSGPNITLGGNGGFRMTGNSTLTLIWNGAKWIEITRSDNFRFN